MSGRTLGCAALTAILLLPATLLGGPNRLTNPSFEGGLAGWLIYGNVFAETAHAQEGLQSLKLFGNWSSAWNASGAYQNLPAAPGQPWTFTGYGLNPATDGLLAGNQNIALLKIIWFDGPNATGNQLQPLPGPGALFGEFPGIESGQLNANTPPDQWQQLTAGGEAPPGTQSVQLMAIFLQPNFEGGSLWFDNLSATVGGCATHDPVFDLDDSGTVGVTEFEAFMACWTGPAILMAADVSLDCKCMDRNADLAIDLRDFGVFQRCYTGDGPVDPACDD